MDEQQPVSFTAPPRPGYGPVLRHAVARRLAGATLVTGLGDFVALGALLVVATERAGGLAVGAAGLLAAQVVPGLLAGTLLSGRLARVPVRPGLVAASALGAGGICLVLAVEQLWAVYVAALLLGASRAVTAPLTSKAMAQHVPGRLRPPLVGILGTVFQAVQVVGVIAGSLAASRGLAAEALWVDLASFTVAALLFGRLPRGASADVPGRVRSPLDGLRVVHHHPVARSLVPAAWATLFVGAVPEAVLPSTIEGDLLAPALAAGPLASAGTAFLIGRGDRLTTPAAARRAAGFVPVATLVFACAFLVGDGVALAIAAIAGQLLLGATLGWIVAAQAALARTVGATDLAHLTATMAASVLVLEGAGALLVGVLADLTTVTGAIAVVAAVSAVLLAVSRGRVPSDTEYRQLVA